MTLSLSLSKAQIFNEKHINPKSKDCINPNHKTPQYKFYPNETIKYFSNPA